MVGRRDDVDGGIRMPDGSSADSPFVSSASRLPTTTRVSTFDLIKRIEAHVVAIRRAPYYAACAGRAHVVVAEHALAAVVNGDAEIEYPIERPKRNHDYHGPRPAPGQTVMLCPVESKMMLFNFLPEQMLECDKCGFRISREKATS